MAVHLSLERCDVVCLDRSRRGIALGSQPQRSPTSATNCGPQGADLTTKLWGSAENLYGTDGFVASTGLKIWPARLSIAEEQEEEVNDDRDSFGKTTKVRMNLRQLKEKKKKKNPKTKRQTNKNWLVNKQIKQ